MSSPRAYESAAKRPLAVICGGTAGERVEARRIIETSGFCTLELRSPHDLGDKRAEGALLCLLLAGDDPVGAIQRAGQLLPHTRLVMAGRDDVHLAAAAVRAGAWDYLSRSPLSARLPHVLEELRQKEPAGLLSRVRKSDHLIGISPGIREVLRLLERACMSDVPVLVSGESGTGKELAARMIHFAGRRARRPFVALNCGAVPEHLAEAELFGHEKGAFTGASHKRPGLFLEANGGTLFLDEIGEAPPALQTKLLRAVETGEVTPLGTTRASSMNVRIISATNHDLEEAVGAGRFRADLYYRLCAFPLHMPPLRNRPEDIPLLAVHFLRNGEVSRRAGAMRISAAALRKLMSHTWPGNVRELINVLSRAAVMAHGDTIEEHDVSLPDEDRSEEGVPPFKEAKAAFESGYVRRLLSLTGGVVSEAARLAGKERKDFYVLMRRHGIVPSRFRDRG